MMKILRYPETKDKSLQAWNAADELIIDYLNTNQLLSKEAIIYHDRFGYLSCHLHQMEPKIVITFKSQELAIAQNLKNNQLNSDNKKLIKPLDEISSSIDLGIIKIPKSIDLFEVYLRQLASKLKKDSVVICGFMTRHFSQQAIEMAQKYFEEVEQTKAWKKARLIILKSPRKVEKKELVHEIKWGKDRSLKQYYGVFSASKIDMASQFLMEHLEVEESSTSVLDLGCGNGVLACKARQLNSQAHLHLTDDNIMAISSAPLNLGSSPLHHFHFTNSLADFPKDYFDLVISNPPFHFEYENNIEITLNLFHEVHQILKPKGNFQLVANIHLNYKTHLDKIFKTVEIIAQNQKFVIYKCLK